MSSHFSFGGPFSVFFRQFLFFRGGPAFSSFRLIPTSFFTSSELFYLPKHRFSYWRLQNNTSREKSPFSSPDPFFSSFNDFYLLFGSQNRENTMSNLFVGLLLGAFFLLFIGLFFWPAFSSSGGAPEAPRTDFGSSGAVPDPIFLPFSSILARFGVIFR